MRPSQALRSGGGGDTPLGKYNHYIGDWGSMGPKIQSQRGIISYGIAPNRQNPFAHAGHDAIFNSWRRVSRQVLYWAPTAVAGYFIMSWAFERNHYLNSKAGRAETAANEE
ncbi:ubiquinol-cytochrome c reductase complex subunit [Grosmannia clavigera kw1407]|uniref:Cytochrome b-c1 complex subunit 8 n=1 Tax=Grosmannia clavigera (strain kw1407 / UAMH 11150) TaxID=655863 RepID=F0XM50_GROCL|nr:ubiquinol-cytochrome c reductase complex subunit [Grosmannia clavigera kw1407]EFX01384.1 ubiquinol-cytochrome c reductase complex subunit [Grosmannia clavigera kw1407]